MSSSAAQDAYDTISQINFTGGFPTKNDLAPSIIFAVLYGISLPVIFWRLFSARDRTIILLRPLLCALCRIGMLSLRAYMSLNTYGINHLIAELTLVGIGYLFLLEPLTSLWKRHIDATLPPPHPYWVQRLSKLLKMTLLASIGCIIASGALSSQAFDNPSTLNTVVALRHASYCLSLGVVVLNIVTLALTHFIYNLDKRRSLYLVVPTCALLIVGVYRVAQTFESNPSAPARSLAAFWILEIFFEFVAYCCYLAISIPTWFPKTDYSNGTAYDTETGQVNARQTTTQAITTPLKGIFGEKDNGEVDYLGRRRRGLLSRFL